MKFRKEYGFLSNMASVFSGIRYENLIYPTVENAYQAAKLENEADRQIFTQISPVEAKKLSHKITKRPDWHQINLGIMKNLLDQKFAVPYFRNRLLATGDVELVENNEWHDNFWGSCTCPRCQNKKHENHLGKMLMEIRDELHKQGYGKKP